MEEWKIIIIVLIFIDLEPMYHKNVIVVVLSYEKLTKFEIQSLPIREEKNN
jgi:hypothetical protein